MAKSLNADTGFNIRVNLYIIRCIFKNFKEQLSKELGKEIDMSYLYDMLNIERQQFQSICGGKNFLITKEQTEKIAKLFNIEEQYFVGDGKMFNVYGLNEQKWKCFFNVHYNKKYNVALPEKKQKEYKKEVDDTLNNTFKGFDEVTKNYNPDNPIFRVAFYCYMSRPYEKETLFQQFRRGLKNVEVTGWDELKDNNNIEELETCKELLEKHVQYIQALVTISKYNSK